MEDGELSKGWMSQVVNKPEGERDKWPISQGGKPTKE